MPREWKYNKGDFVRTTKLERAETQEVTSEDGTKIQKQVLLGFGPVYGQIVSKRGFGGDTVHEYLIRPAREDRLKQFKAGEFIAPNDATPDIWVSDTEIEGKV